MVLAPEIENMLLLIVDNPNCYVLAKSVNYCVEQLGSDVCPLPENTASYGQLLDVGVMELLKAKIGNMWLANTIMQTLH
jgi:DDE superfamily endonuclease